jgi:release factor glutamine methyltransferase
MKATIQYIREELSGLYPVTEIEAFIRLIFEHVCIIDYRDMILKYDFKLDKGCKEKISEVVQRLKNFEPIQYIMGATQFINLKLKVNPSVFIPRPETEELVWWITDSCKYSSPSILDIGTGSGCIALALGQQIGMSQVSAVDVTKDVIEKARYNADSNNLHVNFFCADILRWEDYKWDYYDIIVSNPPYVMEKEKKDMPLNVLKFEPHEALFVPDDDPLVFYRSIAEFASHFLCKEGWLYFEINEQLGDEIMLLLKYRGFGNVEIKKDINDKDRMIRCSKSK